MDASAKKLVQELETLRRQRVKIDRRMEGILTSLDILGIRAPEEGPVFTHGITEDFYAEGKPFLHTSLSVACLPVLRDFDVWMDKNQVEYLVTVGSYPFEAKDPTNSIEMALRRLATEGKCAIEKRGGPHTSMYK